jgi:glycosyltransferase involved in cell wall biosynthesis
MAPPLRILVLTDRFTPEIAAPSFRLMEHAKVWRELGHEVAVVTCVPNFPRGRAFPGYRNLWFQEEVLEGIRVLRVWSYLAANEGTVRRTLDYVSYMVSAVLQHRRYPDVDVVLASSPPFFVAMAGWALARARRCPWVFEIRDLWPASIRAVGVSAGRGLALIERAELGLYRDADRVLALTHAFRDDLVSRGIDEEKIDVVTNGVDAEVFHPGAVAFDARERLGVPRSAFLAGYLGTVGLAHGLRTLLDVAERLRGESDVRLLLMGEGAQRRSLEEEAARRGLSHVIFRDFAPHHEIPSYLAALDASIVHLRPDPVFRTVIPSKIFESMAMGVPLVMAVEGESARVVAEAGAGLCVPSGDAAAIAAALLQLRADPVRREGMRRRGMESVRARYARRRLAEAALQTLERAHAGAEGGR